VYLSDLQVLKIWDFGSVARSELGKYSRAKPSQPAAWEALGSVPSHVTEGNMKQFTFGKRPGWTHARQ
jgi:hypothetical protein